MCVSDGWLQFKVGKLVRVKVFICVVNHVSMTSTLQIKSDKEEFYCAA